MLISIFSWFFHTIFQDFTEQFYIQNATECTILRPSEKNSKVQNVVLQNFILNIVPDWFNDKELTNGSFLYKLRGKRLRKGPK
jgi:hypothetical protein